jgi:hypothetical protein
MPFGVYSSGIPPLRRPARKLALNRVWLTVTIGEGRIVEMSAGDADCLIRAGWTKLAE